MSDTWLLSSNIVVEVSGVIPVAPIAVLVWSALSSRPGNAACVTGAAVEVCDPGKCSRWRSLGDRLEKATTQTTTATTNPMIRALRTCTVIERGAGCRGSAGRYCG